MSYQQATGGTCTDFIDFDAATCVVTLIVVGVSSTVTLTPEDCNSVATRMT